MARISAEKAVEIIGSRFDLVLVAAQRARELKNGSIPMTDNPGQSVTVTALREIEEGKYTKEDYLKKLSKKGKQ
jgi:DNA-directed RNA polymerase subunit omega